MNHIDEVGMMPGLIDAMVTDRIADGTHDAWVPRDPAEDRGYERFGDGDERDEEVIGQLGRKTSLQLLHVSALALASVGVRV